MFTKFSGTCSIDKCRSGKCCDGRHIYLLCWMLEYEFLLKSSIKLCSISYLHSCNWMNFLRISMILSLRIFPSGPEFVQGCLLCGAVNLMKPNVTWEWKRRRRRRRENFFLMGHLMAGSNSVTQVISSTQQEKGWILYEKSILLKFLRPLLSSSHQQSGSQNCGLCMQT